MITITLLEAYAAGRRQDINLTNRQKKVRRARREMIGFPLPLLTGAARSVLGNTYAF
jgi:hypothetical protein